MQSSHMSTIVFAPPGSRLAGSSWPEDTGPASQESAIETLCCLAYKPDGGGFRVFWQDCWGSFVGRPGSGTARPPRGDVTAI